MSRKVSASEDSAAVCPRPGYCPLSQVRAGTSVRIKQLLAAPDLCQRLRELGLCEEQRIKLLLQDRSVVCQVCNVRLGLSGPLADAIWVEPLLPAAEAVAAVADPPARAA